MRFRTATPVYNGMSALWTTSLGLGASSELFCEISVLLTKAELAGQIIYFSRNQHLNCYFYFILNNYCPFIDEWNKIDVCSCYFFLIVVYCHLHVL